MGRFLAARVLTCRTWEQGKKKTARGERIFEAAAHPPQKTHQVQWHSSTGNVNVTPYRRVRLLYQWLHTPYFDCREGERVRGWTPFVVEVVAIVIWTLQSISICLIRSHYLEYSKYLNLDEEKYNMRGNSVCYFPSGKLYRLFKLLL